MARVESFPVIGWFFKQKKEGVAPVVSITSDLRVLSSRPISTDRKDAVVAIWAMGKTDFDVVRARVEEQFPDLSIESIDKMMGKVRQLREKGIF